MLLNPPYVGAHALACAPGQVMAPGVYTINVLQQPIESLQECAVFQTQFPMI